MKTDSLETKTMKTHSRKTGAAKAALWILAATFSALAVSACTGDKDPEESIDAEACEHLQEGPATAVAASLSSSDAPAIDSDHMRYDVALVANTAGWVSYAAAEAADYAFFLGADVPVAFFDASGASLPIEESTTSSPECDEIKGRHLIELPVGTANLRLGATTTTSVGIVVEEAAHSH